VSITAAGITTAAVTLAGLPDITLWDTGNPKLYTVIATLKTDGRPLHDTRVRIGFREAVFRLDGFYLNGVRTKLFGLNRHQLYPFAGMALPDRVQAKDAEILRNELNCNIVRCSHYPQSEAFYDAADELGLLVWEEIPGWGYFGDAAWQQAAQGDVRDMIIRDRNHPSVIVWGVMPNEAGSHPEQYALCNDLAHFLDPSRPTGGDGQRSDAGYVFDVFSEHDYHGVRDAAGIRWPELLPPDDAAGKPYLVGEAVGTFSGPGAYYRRTDPQFIQQGEAIAHARVHDTAHGDDRYSGVIAWAAFDYPSGNGNHYQGIKYVGVADLFRILKPGAAIYQAQADPARRPVIAPAFYWDFGAASPVTALSPVMIASNLDSLDVYVGDTLLASVTPDTKDYPNLPYPPSFVDFSKVDGRGAPELRIDGYRGGVLAATRRFSADPSLDRLSVEADDTEIDADGIDATRVAFRAVDRYGNARPYAGGQVTLELSGPGALVGESPFDLGPSGGVGAVWIRSLPGSPGEITVRASHPGLGTARVTIKTQHAPNGLTAAPRSPLAVPVDKKSDT
jgi:beta-galactosidase